jgi:hypothetical protein
LVKTFSKTEVERKRFFSQNGGFERKIKYLIVYIKKSKSNMVKTKIYISKNIFVPGKNIFKNRSREKTFSPQKEGV